MLDTATLGKRELNRLNNRKAILDAARTCFRESGYEQTTIRDIIRRTDLAAGTFYNYFSDKRDIFIALFQHFLETLRTRLKNGQGQLSNQESVRHIYSALFLTAAYDPVTYELAHRNEQAIRELFGTDLLGLATASLERHTRLTASQNDMSAQDPEYLGAACRGIAYEVSLQVAQKAIQLPHDAEQEAHRAAEFVTRLLYAGAREEGSEAQRKRA